MNRYAATPISLMQFIFIISGIQVSVAVLSLPRKLAEFAGTDGWIALILGWAINITASFLIIQVMKKHPEGTLLDLVTRYTGRWAGRMAAVVFALYFLCLGFDGLSRSILLIKVWLLPNTAAYVIMILLLIPTYSIARYHPSVLGRYAELVVFLSIWIPFVYLLTLKNAHWLHLMPLLKKGWGPVFSAIPATIYPSLGMVSAFFLYPNLRKKETAFTGMLIANTLTTLLYLFITIMCFLFFSPDEINTYNDPVISVLKSIEFKFIERIEILFISFYLFIFSLVWVPAMYLTTFCTSWLLGKQDNRMHLRLVCLVLIMVYYFHNLTFNQSDRLEQILAYVGFGMEYMLPACLLLYLSGIQFFQKRSGV